MKLPSQRPGILRASMLALALTACHGASSPDANAVRVDLRHNPSGQGTKAITFGNDSITAEELTRRFAEMAPLGRARFQATAERKSYAENLARFELLANEAAREGLAQDPDVLEAAKRTMVNKLMEKHLKTAVQPASDAEVEAHYKAHLPEFVRPEQLRLSLILLDAPKGSPGRAAAQKKADALLAQVKSEAPGDFIAFGKLARENSQDNRTQVLNGDTTLRPVGDLAKDYGQELVEAAKGLMKTGDVAPVLATDRGFFVFKLNTRMPALDRELSTKGVREQIMAQLSYEKRHQALEQYVAELKTRAHYNVDEKVLAEIKVDPSAPSLPSTAHGGVPRMTMTPGPGGPMHQGPPMLPGGARPQGLSQPSPLLVPSPAPAGGSRP